MIGKTGISRSGAGVSGAAQLGIGGVDYFGPASPLEIIWWGRGGVESGTDNVVNDRIGTLTDAIYVGNNCLSFNGTSDYITIPEFDGGSSFDIEWNIKFNSYANDPLLSNAAGNRWLRYTQTAVEGFLYGTFFSATLDTSLPSTGTWFRLGINVSGTTVQTRVNGSVISNNTWPSAPEFNDIINAFARVGNSYADIVVSEMTIEGHLHYLFAEGEGSIVYDIGGNTNDATINSATWATDDTIDSHNIINGFSLYEHATSPDILVPYGTDGSPLAITPPAGYSKTSDNPGGFTHNGAESTIRQSDSVFTGGTASFWSADGLSIDDKTKAQLDTHYSTTNGSLRLWIRKVGDNVFECAQYPLDYTFSAAEIARNKAYFGGTSIL
jgi:hypothetical protein